MKNITLWKSVFLGLLFSAILFSCAGDEDLRTVEFPMKDGSSWRYVHRIKIYLVDSLGQKTLDYSDSSQVFVTVKGDTVLRDSVKVKEITVRWDTQWGVYSQSAYYSMENDGLYMIAVKNYFSQSIPKTGVEKLRLNKKIADYLCAFYLHYPLLEYSAAKTDDIYYYSPPFKTYSYPLKPGVEWVANKIDDEGPVFSRKALNWTNIFSGDELYECLKIEFLVSDVSEIDKLELYEYLSEYGIISRDFHIQDVPATGEDGEVAGETTDYYETLELLEILEPRN